MANEFDQFFNSGGKGNQVDDLEQSLGHIWEISKEFGLEPCPTHFELVPAHKIYEIGSYGLPVRFSHWSYGRAYRQMKTMYDHGLSKIYEVVINSNPAQGYLLDNNDSAANKMVLAHVLAHVDFFTNSNVFKPTPKDMPQTAALSAERIRGYGLEVGENEVERYLDSCLTIEEHIDPDEKNFYRLPKDRQITAWREEDKEKRRKAEKPKTEYDDVFNIGQTQEKLIIPDNITIPYHPDRDLLHIIREYSPVIKDWQKDVLDIVRSESIYFRPQMRTKIMNEGWATFWHKRIMREMGRRGHISPAEQEGWWTLHAGVVHPNPKHINPYYVGMTIFDYLEDYYNGKIEDEEKRWLESERLPIYPEYNGPIEDSPGRKKIRSIMKTEDDQGFLRNHFDKIACDRTATYIYEREEIEGEIRYVVKEKDWKIIREVLVQSQNNSGYPYLEVTDCEYYGKHELHISHLYEGRELDSDYIKKTLPHIFRLWGRPVHLQTTFKDRKVEYVFDGDDIDVSYVS
ncbi:MAG: SpoVR family protein [Microgenomates group bacterium]|jgi:stage V sporulation protein R